MPRTGRDESKLIDRASSNKPVPTPRSVEKRKEWMDIYFEHVHEGYSTREIARVHGIAMPTVQKAIRWAASDTAKSSLGSEVMEQKVLDRIDAQYQKLHKLYEEAVKPTQKLSILREIRQTIGFESRFSGLMNDDSSANVAIQINMPNLHRGEGTEKVISQDVD